MSPPLDCSREPIGIVGAGKVGQAFGRVLRESGEPVACVASRNFEHAVAAARFIGPEVKPVLCHQISAYARRVLIAVPDDSIEQAAAALDLKRGIALHTSGSRDVEVLRPLSERGVFCGTIHPLQNVPDALNGAASLRGAYFAVSGDPAAVQWAEKIAAAAEGKVIRIPSEMRPLYHASAVMASNYLMALLAAAHTLMSMTGVDSGEALQALGPLVRVSVDNALKLGPRNAITGPIQRGDSATVASNLKAIASASGAVQGFYKAAGLMALEIATARGLAQERAEAIEQLLQSR